MIKCKICNEEFTDTDNLEAHLWDGHFIKADHEQALKDYRYPDPCPICGGFVSCTPMGSVAEAGYVIECTNCGHLLDED